MKSKSAIVILQLLGGSKHSCDIFSYKAKTIVVVNFVFAFRIWPHSLLLLPELLVVFLWTAKKIEIVYISGQVCYLKLCHSNYSFVLYRLHNKVLNLPTPNL